MPYQAVEGLSLSMIAQETGTSTESSHPTFLFFLPSFGFPVSYSVELPQALIPDSIVTLDKGSSSASPVSSSVSIKG